MKSSAWAVPNDEWLFMSKTFSNTDQKLGLFAALHLDLTLMEASYLKK